MIYRDYEITAEVITARAEYSLNDQGEPEELLQDIDMEAEEVTAYCIVKNGDVINWVDTLDDARQYINKLTGVK
jgi:hypothetical protein